MTEKDINAQAKQLAKLEKQAQAYQNENALLKEELKKVVMAHEEAIRSKQETIADNVKLRAKLAEYEKEKIFIARAKRITSIANLMLEKGMLTKERYKQQIQELSEMDDKQLESWKKVVINTQSTPITASDNSSKKVNANAVANMNPVFIPTDDEKTAGTMSPPSLDKLMGQLPWSTGMKDGI
jgi:hypothetical protein